MFMGKNTGAANDGSREQMGSTTVRVEWALTYIRLHTYCARPRVPALHVGLEKEESPTWRIVIRGGAVLVECGTADNRTGASTMPVQERCTCQKGSPRTESPKRTPHPMAPGVETRTLCSVNFSAIKVTRAQYI